MKDVITVLFGDFETLDVFGPIEILGRLPEQFNPRFVSISGGEIVSSHKVRVATEKFSDVRGDGYILFVPGGNGVRNLVGNAQFVGELKRLADAAETILTVCTGSILLSKTGLLDGKRATSNKRVFLWTGKESPAVQWVKKARWVKDANIYTSSGVSAGMDMALGFAAETLGYDTAKKVSVEIEYDWKENPEDDPFADLY